MKNKSREMMGRKKLTTPTTRKINPRNDQDTLSMIWEVFLLISSTNCIIMEEGDGDERHPETYAW
jgi:hypothetical protein